MAVEVKCPKCSTLDSYKDEVPVLMVFLCDDCGYIGMIGPDGVRDAKPGEVPDDHPAHRMRAAVLSRWN